MLAFSLDICRTGGVFSFYGCAIEAERTSGSLTVTPPLTPEETFSSLPLYHALGMTYSVFCPNVHPWESSLVSWNSLPGWWVSLGGNDAVPVLASAGWGSTTHGECALWISLTYHSKFPKRTPSIHLLRISWNPQVAQIENNSHNADYFCYWWGVNILDTWVRPLPGERVLYSAVDIGRVPSGSYSKYRCPLPNSKVPVA